MALSSESLDCTDSRDYKMHRLEENIGSINVVLTADELAKIDTTVNGITLVGDRYPEFLEKQIDR